MSLLGGLKFYNQPDDSFLAEGKRQHWREVLWSWLVMVSLTRNNTAVLFLLRANITTAGVKTLLLHRELLTGSKLAIGLAAFHFYYLNRPLKCAWECVRYIKIVLKERWFTSLLCGFHFTVQPFCMPSLKGTSCLWVRPLAVWISARRAGYTVSASHSSMIKWIRRPSLQKN